jgi:predicted amidohydrolase
VTSGAPLENVSLVVSHEGELLALSRKAFPTADEQPFVRAADVDDIAVVETPAGKLGVLVCADAWFPQSYERLKEKGADLIAVPTFHTGKWRGDWHGYSGHKEPDDVDQDDIGALTEAEAWDRYALAGRANGTQVAVTAPLRGSLWDLHDDGQAYLVTPYFDAGFERMPRHDGAGLFLLRAE